MSRPSRCRNSVPESTALRLDAAGLRVVHSGDWKLDPTPLLGRPADLARLRALGSLGVNALFCDSTNAGKPGRAGSEAHVALGVAAVCRETKGMVVVAGFSSHLARMAAAAAAMRDGRHVGLTGRSMARVGEAGARAGYVADPKAFLDLPHLAKIPARHRLLLATGAQGEKGGGLDRLLAGQPSLHLGRGDALVLAARTIPGNERQVARITARARAVGARVVRNDETFGPHARPVHVSGHACRDDLAALCEELRPRALVPIHGSPEHIAAHAAFGTAQDVGTVPPPVDGRILEIRRGGIRAAGGAALRPWAWDGRRVRLARSTTQVRDATARHRPSRRSRRPPIVLSVPTPNQTMPILLSRRLLPLLITQTIGAVQDHLVKTDVLAAAVFGAVGMDPGVAGGFAGLLRTPPFFFLSGRAGLLADRFDQAAVARATKALAIPAAGFSSDSPRSSSAPYYSSGSSPPSSPPPSTASSPPSPPPSPRRPSRTGRQRPLRRVHPPRQRSGAAHRQPPLNPPWLGPSQPPGLPDVASRLAGPQQRLGAFTVPAALAA